MMAILLPVLMVALLVVLAVVVLYVRLAFSNERKHLAVIEKLMPKE